MNKTYCDKCNIEIDKTTDRHRVHMDSYTEVTVADEYGGRFLTHKFHNLDLCNVCGDDALRFMTTKNLVLLDYKCWSSGYSENGHPYEYEEVED